SRKYEMTLTDNVWKYGRDAPGFLELICLYHERWEIETTFDELDTHQLCSHPLRSHKPLGVIQELYALLLAHFVARVWMHRAACFHSLDPDRLSFVNSIRLLTDAIFEFQLVDPC